VGARVGRDDGDAVGEGVDLPGRYVGSSVGAAEGSMDGEDDGRGVGEPKT